MLRQMVAEVIERDKVKLISINPREKEEEGPREAWLQEPFLAESEQAPAKPAQDHGTGVLKGIHFELFSLSSFTLYIPELPFKIQVHLHVSAQCLHLAIMPLLY